ncbi:MAG: hypothetical protein ACTH5D_05200 [Halomonas sp.]|uniref:hypothetical protein n=1 Tax=Halomonas sp. TaxID=1486246 RepID=UPI003F8F06F2
MSAKQTTKKAPPTPRKEISLRVKTKSPGVKRQVCGVIFDNTWKHITLDDRGSAYKAIARDPAMMMEPAPAPVKEPEPKAAEETQPGKEAK